MKPTSLRMTKDNLLVKPIVEGVTASGIWIPETAQVKRSDRGTVVRLGPGPIIEEMGLRVGDTVVVEDFVGSGTEVVLNGERHLMFGADEVLAVLS